MTQPSRWVEFTAAYDRRDPNPNKSYGIHGVDMRFLLRGPKGVTVFALATNWHLPEVQREIEREHGESRGPLPMLLGYHSPAPIYEGQTQTIDSCEYLGGKPCYHDCSYLAADRVFNRLLREGDGGVWAELETFYADQFGEPWREGDVE